MLQLVVSGLTLVTRLGTDVVGRLLCAGKTGSEAGKLCPVSPGVLE